MSIETSSPHDRHRPPDFRKDRWRRGGWRSNPEHTANDLAPDDLCYLSAVELASRIRRKELSARELIAAHLARTEQVNPKVNAVVTLVADQARADAAGPMARSVADVALYLSVLAGPNPGNPLTLADDPSHFASALDANVKGARVAWWQNLGGIPVEPEIRRVVDANRAVFESLGCVVEAAEPDFTGVDEAFPTLRHLSYHSSYAALAKQKPDWVKDTIRWEIAEAERQSAADVAHAMDRQAKMYAESTRFFQRYDYFVLPVTQVIPFDVTTPFPTSIDGTPMPTYIDWMRSCWYVTFMANPAISLPAGFSNTGLPVGLQLVGRHRDEWSVLRMAYAFEQATQHAKRRPSVVGGA